ncbi:hypothetical protein KO561_09005 [Radiobacillus kanasensis]|uniref:hypothetical protein n=1 Tax=Radiobacillus kanasensis TaxID=2844358 RepID=UPI001E657FD4|nr:hypothetical protein [Radiobacillus kanasensis]UFU01052.1 hypothetical protein KO561_09005 [Radiobacillus kanasensis]
MLTFLVAMSLLLHVLSFLAIRMLLGKVNKLSQYESNDKQRMTEMEDLFATYLEEIKLENEKLEQAIIQTENTRQPVVHGKETSSTIATKTESVTPPKEVKKTTEEKNSIVEKEEEAKKSNLVELPSDESDAYSPPTELPMEDIVEQSLQSKVYQLHDQGYTVEEIAKRLDCGKTEVDLMLKFKS